MSPSLASKQAPVAGSPLPGEPAFLAVGKLRRPHGVRGEIIMDILTDFPERLLPGIQVYLGDDHQPLRLLKRRWHETALLVAFEGYDTPESVGEFRNQIVFVNTADRPPLPEGEYYHHQLIGLQVISQSGESLGKVTDILETGANDVLVVRTPAGTELLLPMIDSVVLEINLTAGTIRVHLLPGLVEG